MAKDDKDKKEEKDDAHRQIIPVSADPVMFSWLEDLFCLSPKDTAPKVPKTEPDSFPERIMLRPIFGTRGLDLGPPIKNKEWKPMQAAQPSREQLVQLSNEMLSAAQQACNVNQRRQRYGLFAYSPLKGADYYQSYMFVLEPTAKEYGAKGGPSAPATDDEDTHRDRLLSSALVQARWQQEQYSEAVSGILKLQNEIIRQQADTIARQDSERRAWILASEEALSKKQEREIAAAWSQAKITALADIWGSVKGLLPAAMVYATKGKAGIVEGLRMFIDGLTPETRDALFGKPGNNGTVVEPGILDENQVILFGDIADGKADPSRISEFMVGLRPDQMMAAQQLLSPNQLQTLIGLAKAASETSKSNGSS